MPHRGSDLVAFAFPWMRSRAFAEPTSTLVTSSLIGEMTVEITIGGGRLCFHGRIVPEFHSSAVLSF